MNTSIADVQAREDERMYLMRNAHACWTLSFDVAFEQTRLLALRLGRPALAPFEAERGTLALLDKRAALLEIAANANCLGTWFAADTPHLVQRTIDRLIHTEEAVRIFYGDPNSGRANTDEYGTIGRVHRSAGVLRVPLLIEEDEPGGVPINDARIVRIVRLGDGRNLYRHPGFHVPTMLIVHDEHPQFQVSVLVDGVVEARFDRYSKACHWVAFMGGETHRPLK